MNEKRVCYGRRSKKENNDVNAGKHAVELTRKSVNNNEHNVTQQLNNIVTHMAIYILYTYITDRLLTYK